MFNLFARVCEHSREYASSRSRQCEHSAENVSARLLAPVWNGPYSWQQSSQKKEQHDYDVWLIYI